MIKSFTYAFNGLKIFIREESNARIHLLAVVLVNTVGWWYQFTLYEWIAVWMCIALVFVTEILNTALENLCDHISPEKHENIARIKDLGAAAVLVSAINSLVVSGLIFANRFLHIF